MTVERTARETARTSLSAWALGILALSVAGCARPHLAAPPTHLGAVAAPRAPGGERMVIRRMVVPAGEAPAPTPSGAPRILEQRVKLQDDVVLRLPSTGQASVPFRTGLNHVLVDLRDASGRVFTFFLDTGASFSVVTPELLQVAKLPVLAGAAHKVAAVGAPGPLRAGLRLRRLRRMRIGALEIEQAGVAVVDMGHVTKAFGMPIHGVVGYNILSRLITVVDYPAKRVTFVDPDHPNLLRPLGKPTAVVPFGFRRGTFIEVSGSVDGAPAAPFLFDLGARLTVLNAAAAASTGLRFTSVRRSPLTGGRPKLPVKAARAGSLQFGALRLDRPLLHQVDLPVFRPLGMAGRPGGVLGNDLLGKLQVAIDYRRQRLSFWRR